MRKRAERAEEQQRHLETRAIEQADDSMQQGSAAAHLQAELDRVQDAFPLAE